MTPSGPDRSAKTAPAIAQTKAQKRQKSGAQTKGASVKRNVPKQGRNAQPISPTEPTDLADQTAHTDPTTPAEDAGIASRRTEKETELRKKLIAEESERASRKKGGKSQHARVTQTGPKGTRPEFMTVMVRTKRSGRVMTAPVKISAKRFKSLQWKGLLTTKAKSQAKLPAISEGDDSEDGSVDAQEQDGDSRMTTSYVAPEFAEESKILPGLNDPSTVALTQEAEAEVDDQGDDLMTDAAKQDDSGVLQQLNFEEEEDADAAMIDATAQNDDSLSFAANVAETSASPFPCNVSAISAGTQQSHDPNDVFGALCSALGLHTRENREFRESMREVVVNLTHAQSKMQQSTHDQTLQYLQYEQMRDLDAKFNGDAKTTLDYVAQLRKYLLRYPFVDKRHAYSVISLTLSEGVEQQFTEHCAQLIKEPTTDILIEWILKTFPPEMDRHSLEQNLRKIRHRKGEDPRIVFRRFHSLMKKTQQALRDMNREYAEIEPLSEREIVSALRLIFIVRNNPNAGGAVSHDINKRTFKELGKAKGLSKWSGWEPAITKLHSKLVPPNCRGMPGIGYEPYPVQKDELYLVKPRSSRLEKKGGDGSNDKGDKGKSKHSGASSDGSNRGRTSRSHRGNDRCSHCGSRYHKSRDCRQKDMPRCHRCGRKGHKRLECRANFDMDNKPLPKVASSWTKPGHRSSNRGGRGKFKQSYRGRGGYRGGYRGRGGYHNTQRTPYRWNKQQNEENVQNGYKPQTTEGSDAQMMAHSIVPNNHVFHGNMQVPQMYHQTLHPMHYMYQMQQQPPQAQPQPAPKTVKAKRKSCISS